VADHGVALTRLADRLGEKRSRIARITLPGGAAPPQTLPEALLVTAPMLSRLQRRNPRLLDELRQRTLLLLVVQAPEFGALGPLLHLADGLLFVDSEATGPTEAAGLAAAGLSAIPAAALRGGADGQRRTPATGHDANQARILAMLGAGLSNRSIAAQLQLPESAVKSSVRSAMAKLRFRNRTELGLFAAKRRVPPRQRTAQRRRSGLQ
jgi:DNA-binding NarL/FixJ family response regulator